MAVACLAWQGRDHAARLGPGEVHAWIVDLDGPGAGTTVLGPAELERAAAYLCPRDGVRFAASRAALRVILSGYLGCDPRAVRFVAGPDGRPGLAGGGPQFSLSRSGGRALVAVAAHPVGADLERVEPRPGLADLAAASFGAAEAACIDGGCAGSPVRAFYRHWTAKEAYLKALGRGLAGLRDTELVCGTAPQIRVRGERQAGWTVSVSELAGGYAAAIVAGQPVTNWRRLAG